MVGIVTQVLEWEWWVLTHVRVGVVGICTSGWESWVLRLRGLLDGLGFVFI